MASEEGLKRIRKYTGVMKDSKATEEEKADAANALGSLASTHPADRSVVAAEGALALLVQLLRDGGDRLKGNVAMALNWLAEDVEVAAAIVACGAREPLEALAKDQRDDFHVEYGKRYAGLALKKLPEAPKASPEVQIRVEPETRTTEAAPVPNQVQVEVKSVKGDMVDQKTLEEIRRDLGTLKDPKRDDWDKGCAATALRTAAEHDRDVPAVIAATGGLPLLVQLLHDGGDLAKWNAANALEILAEDKEVAKAIVASGGREPLQAIAKDEREEKWVKLGRASAQKALELLPGAEDTKESTPGVSMEAPSGTANPKQVQVEVKALESDSSDEQCKAAEQLGNWAAASDEKRSEINKAGGCEALVALVVTGSDDAKWHAARALRNLANHAEAKESILKADGIAVLTSLAKHGKGKAKEAASEALNLLSLVDVQAKPAPAVDTKPAESAAATATDIPSGEGTRAAMFSARFDGGPVEKLFRKVFSILLENDYDVLMVAADAGKSFGDLTAKYLGRLRGENGTMIAVCTQHYGEMTASSYSSHEELKFALEYKSSVTVLPLQVEDTYPPKPPGGPDHKFDKEKLAQGYIDMVFKPSVVYIDCRNKSGQLQSERDIAVAIAKELQKYKV